MAVEHSNASVVEKLQWQKFDVLNDGFVCLVDVMGTDYSVVQAARVSYGKDTRLDPVDCADCSKDWGHSYCGTCGGAQKLSAPATQPADRTLIRYLLRHRHTTPFEMAEIKLLVRVPMDCWRQWIRHRTANVNEYSTRYTEAINSTQATPPDQWRLQATANKQGSDGHLTEWPDDIAVDESGQCVVVYDKNAGKEIGIAIHEEEGTRLFASELTPGEFLTQQEEEFQIRAREVYDARLRMGVAREQARKDLPLCTYTEAYWKIDLHNLLSFLSLRMDPHAQLEIREYAKVIGEQIVKPLFPLVWEAFEDYRMKAMQLSRLDIDMVIRLAAVPRPVSVRTFLMNQLPEWAGLERCRERQECWAKLQRLEIANKNEEMQ